ncbi:MAG TPA: M23 family metallopeptidase [Candidatus Eisenbacteria bacterium]
MAPLLLGGVMPARDGLLERWAWSGAFVYPVGDPYRLAAGSPRRDPAFAISRGFGAPEGLRRHQGVDLSNGRGGDIVRAAAHGLVVVAEQRDTTDFGARVVLAHRLPDGSLAYSVYAHFRPGSLLVRPGEDVWLGQPLGRVGRSGNASGDHLHFELRRPRDLEEQWENTPAVDPLVFLAAWLPGHRADTTRAGRYLAWAEEAGLIGPRDEGARPLTRAEWWEMLARAARHPAFTIAARPDSLRFELIECSVLPVRVEARSGDHVRWKEIVRDVKRLRTIGVRLPPAPLPRAALGAECERVFGTAKPLTHLAVISRATLPVARADACLLLAEVAAPDSLRGTRTPAHRAHGRPPGPTPPRAPHPGATTSRPGP